MVVLRKATESKRKLLDKEKRVISVSHPLPYKHTTYKGLHTRGREGLHLTPTFMYCPQTSICGLDHWCHLVVVRRKPFSSAPFIFCSSNSSKLYLGENISTSPDLLALASNWVSMKYTVSFKLPQRRGGNKTTAKLVRELCLLFSYYKIETWH